MLLLEYKAYQINQRRCLLWIAVVDKYVKLITEALKVLSASTGKTGHTRSEIYEYLKEEEKIEKSGKMFVNQALFKGYMTHKFKKDGDEYKSKLSFFILNH